MIIGQGRFDYRLDVYLAGETDEGVFFLTNDPRMPIDDTQVWVGCDPTDRLTVTEAEDRYDEVTWNAEPPLIYRAHLT